MNRQTPIYKNDARFGSTLAKTSCPGRSDICGNGVVYGVLSTSYVIPRCGDVHKFEFTSNPDESPYGCCVVDTSLNDCDDFHNLENTKEEDYSMGINLIDDLDTNEAIQNPRKICHSAPIRNRTIKLAEFFITILWSTLAIIGAALIGGCYEFWFKYGTGDSKGTRCYKIKNNSGLGFVSNYRSTEELSPINWSFPTKMDEYPYTISGGVVFDGIYTILQFNNTALDANSTFRERALISLNAIVKAFQINSILTLIFSRIFISSTLTAISKVYKQIDHPIAKHLAFLLITGILFYIIAKITKTDQWNIGIGFIFFLLLVLSLLAMCLVILSTNFMSYFYHTGFNNSIGNKFNAPLNAYHELFYGVFYPVFSIKDSKQQAFNTVKNIGLGILSIITYSCAIGTGFIGAILGLCYMVISLFCNIFFVPLWMGSECLFTIIKDQSELLIILFCLSIVLSSHQNLNSTTTIVIALLVGIIALYKMYTLFNSNST